MESVKWPIILNDIEYDITQCTRIIKLDLRHDDEHDLFRHPSNKPMVNPTYIHNGRIWWWTVKFILRLKWFLKYEHYQKSWLYFHLPADTCIFLYSAPSVTALWSLLWEVSIKNRFIIRCVHLEHWLKPKLLWNPALRFM